MAMKSNLQGAQTSLHCCLVDFDKLDSGKYYADCEVYQEVFKSKNWEEEAQKLWDISEAKIKDFL